MSTVTGFSVFSPSSPPGRCLDGTRTYATAASWHIFPLNYLLISRYMVIAADSGVKWIINVISLFPESPAFLRRKRLPPYARRFGSFPYLLFVSLVWIINTDMYFVLQIVGSHQERTQDPLKTWKTCTQATAPPGSLRDFRCPKCIDSKIGDST